MKVAGFSFIRNAVTYDYPIVEAITSILPICDAFYLAVGNSDDGTEALIQSIRSPKIHVIRTVWDEQLRSGGYVLAEETNKAFDAIPGTFDWCFYIQGDEVVHEDDLPAIEQAMKAELPHKHVEGLLFNYRHFYGSYDYIGDSRQWYRHEVRIIRNDKQIRSFQDAQGFRKNGKKLHVKGIEAHVHHYGWVKPPEKQMAKQRSFHKLWHDDNWVTEKLGKASEFDYSGIDSLARFTGSHPHVMKNRITNQNWQFDHDLSRKNMQGKKRFLYAIEQLTGYRVGEYKNYVRIK